jgi:hypothetical protein
VEKVRRAARDARVIDWLRVVVPKAGMVETISEGRMLIDAARSGAHGADAVVVDYDGYGPARAASLVERDLGGDAVRAIASRLALNDALVTANMTTRATVPSSGYGRQRTGCAGTAIGRYRLATRCGLRQ